MFFLSLCKSEKIFSFEILGLLSSKFFTFKKFRIPKNLSKGNKFIISTKGETKTYGTKFELINYLSLIFDLNLTKIGFVVDGWYDTHINELTKDVYKDLKTLKVKLTMFDWEVVDEEGNVLEYDSLIKEIGERVESEDLARTILNEWFNNMKVEYTKENFNLY